MINFEKLKKFQEQEEAKHLDIKQQLIYQISKFGEKYKSHFKIIPDSENFANWFINEYTHEVNRKRRFPFKLDRKYIIRYCILIEQEFDIEVLKEKHNFDLIPKGVEEFEHFNDFLKLLQDLFKDDNKIDNKTILQIIDEVSYIIVNHELPEHSDFIPKNKINTAQASIRFCFYQIYQIVKNRNTPIKRLLVSYLKLKFGVFDNSEKSSISSVFSIRPKKYPR